MAIAALRSTGDALESTMSNPAASVSPNQPVRVTLYWPRTPLTGVNRLKRHHILPLVSPHDSKRRSGRQRSCCNSSSLRSRTFPSSTITPISFARSPDSPMPLTLPASCAGRSALSRKPCSSGSGRTGRGRSSKNTAQPASQSLSDTFCRRRSRLRLLRTTGSGQKPPRKSSFRPTACSRLSSPPERPTNSSRVLCRSSCSCSLSSVPASQSTSSLPPPSSGPIRVVPGLSPGSRSFWTTTRKVTPSIRFRERGGTNRCGICSRSLREPQTQRGQHRHNGPPAWARLWATCLPNWRKG